MKHIFSIIGTIVLFVLTETGYSQVTSPYQVGNWQGFKNCAVSYTFDDGCSGQFTKAIPIFDQFGYKLTLFTVSGWTGNWTNLKNAAAQGHEVANHTSTHPNFGSMTANAQETELTTCNNLINSNISSQKCVTMAYPYCAKGNDALHKKYFIAARGCQGFIEGKTPGDFMNVSSVICGDQGQIKTSANFKTQADNASNSKGWLVYLFHGVDNDGGYSPIPSDTLKKSLEYLKANDSKFWVTTFGNAARYIKERNCALLTETSATTSSITINLTDTLSNNEVFNHPLTIRRTLPEGWTNAAVTQNGAAVNNTIIEVNSVKYIQFDAIPDGGSVVISKVSGVGKNELKGSLNSFNIWINHRDIQFTVPETCGKNPTVSIFDLKGTKLESFSNFSVSNGQGSISLKAIVQPGIYLFQLTDNRSVWNKKIHVTLI
jgi:oligosaccharide reducing-end xylanase